jgi:uncharacterized phiE125 gp8 family phage protein
MPSILLTAPAAEPLTLAEAKLFLRVEHDDDNDLIAALIAGARIHVEAQTGRALITQGWRIVPDAWPADGRIAVSPAPLRTIDAARVYDASDIAHSVDLQAFVPDTPNSAIVFAPWSPPVPGRRHAGIEFGFCLVTSSKVFRVKNSCTFFSTLHRPQWRIPQRVRPT